ncbi:oligosaccharide flippase family protein [Aliikangiella coralliicola]|uniref:oligosaccharide flippase family protein n=1 Tax=Aliikangiella coralliicola TaxID=2592383 RepID=UPI00143E0243|nr:oligosaccharide flippase family protein [Aliikangiella coralliicola]
MKLKTQVVLTSFSKSLKHVSVFILALFLTRYFSPHDYGTYLQVMLVANMAIYLSVFGIPSSIYYFLPRTGEKKKMMKNTILLLCSIAVVVSIGVYFLSEFIATNFNNLELVDYGWLMAVFILLQIPIKLYEPFMITTNNVPKFVMVNASFNFGFLLAVLIPVLLGWNLFEVLLTLFWFFAAQFAAIFLVVFWVYFKLKDEPEEEPYSMKEQFQYSAPIGFAGAINELGIVIDKIIVSGFFNPAQLAIYTRGAMEIPMLNVIANSLGNILMPRFVEEYKKNNIAEVVRLWHSGIRMMATFIYPAFVFFVITAGHLIPFLFTEKYIESVIIFQVYTIVLLTRITSYDAIARAVGQTKVLMKVSLMAVALNIALTIGLVSWIGIIGAPLATVIVTFIVRGSHLWIITKLIDISIADVFPWRSLGKLFAASLVAAVPLIPILNTDLSHFPMLAACGVVFAVSYLLVFRKTGALTDSELKSIRSALPKKLRWVI